MNLILNSFPLRRYPTVIRVINFVTECHTVSHHGAFCFSIIHHTYKVIPSYIFDKRKNRDVKIDFFDSKNSRKISKNRLFKMIQKVDSRTVFSESKTLIHSNGHLKPMYKKSTLVHLSVGDFFKNFSLKIMQSGSK